MILLLVIIQILIKTECIFVSGSHSNQIYNNTVSSCSVAGLYLKAGLLTTLFMTT